MLALVKGTETYIDVLAREASPKHRCKSLCKYCDLLQYKT